MKVAADERELRRLFDIAAAEAGAAFGDPRLYVERFVPRGRHVEVQILGDGRDVVHLGTRDCSIQRRYQKLVEEAPAPDLPAPVRDALHAAAVAFGRHLGYQGLGTVEFLVDSERGEFYFLEMNARIQVEHPVTEAITGIDLVEQQIAIAEGRPLALSADSVTFTGHAVECRLNAEDWEHGFRPSPGTIAATRFPAGPGIRVDTHVQAGTRVPPHYDSLLAKLIVHGRDREEALHRLGRAIARCSIEGVATNLPLHAFVLGQPEFRRGAVNTAWLARVLESRAPVHG
jgi:acetyl-CoA carboxylase biotin carboxylase subunit